MKTFELSLEIKSFRNRISKDTRWNILFISIYTLVIFLVILIKEGETIFEDVDFLLLVLLGNFTLFLMSAMLFSYKSNRYLIRKISFDDSYLFVEFDEYMETKRLKYPLDDVRIKLVQWYHTDSIYLKISNDDTTIKQYRGTGWGAYELREIFKALKEAQKRLEAQQN